MHLFSYWLSFNNNNSVCKKKIRDDQNILKNNTISTFTHTYGHKEDAGEKVLQRMKLLFHPGGHLVTLRRNNGSCNKTTQFHGDFEVASELWKREVGVLGGMQWGGWQRFVERGCIGERGREEWFFGIRCAIYIYIYIYIHKNKY